MNYTINDLQEASQPDLAPERQAELAEGTWAIRKELARWGATDPGVQMKLAQDPDTRWVLAHNPRLRPEVASILAESNDHVVINALMCNRSVTREAVLKAFPDAPVIPDLDAKILQRIEETGGCLDMEHWHTCETAHCRAGWAVVLAGEKGRKLEEDYDTEVAGAIIYVASTGRLPDFFAEDDEALEDMRRAAGLTPLIQEGA